ncbi:uncharacterized protein LOC134612191 [Pelobates fuscus]|uniref:uncharacterized protein LOC134612191 n=1 Tax=Pelobates fuscus TaxID=191477 RepID=UPI002FE4985F
MPDPLEIFEARLEAAFNTFWTNLRERMKQAPQTTKPQVRKRKPDRAKPEKLPKGNPTARPARHTTKRLPGNGAIRGSPHKRRPHTQKGPHQQKAPLHGREEKHSPPATRPATQPVRPRAPPRGQPERPGKARKLQERRISAQTRRRKLHKSTARPQPTNDAWVTAPKPHTRGLNRPPSNRKTSPAQCATSPATTDRRGSRLKPHTAYQENNGFSRQPKPESEWLRNTHPHETQHQPQTTKMAHGETAAPPEHERYTWKVGIG